MLNNEVLELRWLQNIIFELNGVRRVHKLKVRRILVIRKWFQNSCKQNNVPVRVTGTFEISVKRALE